MLEEALGGALEGEARGRHDHRLSLSVGGGAVGGDVGGAVGGAVGSAVVLRGRGAAAGRCRPGEVADAHGLVEDGAGRAGEEVRLQRRGNKRIIAYMYVI